MPVRSNLELKITTVTDEELDLDAWVNQIQDLIADVIESHHINIDILDFEDEVVQ